MPQPRPRQDLPKLLQLTEAIYETALAPDGWNHTTALVGRHFDARYTNLYGVDLQQNTVLFFHSGDTEREVIDTWRRDYAHLDARIAPIVMAQECKPLVNDSVIDRRTFARSAVRNEFLVPTESEETLGCVLWREASRTVVFTANRSGRRGLYTEQDRQFLAMLAPHLRRASMIHCKLEHAAQSLVSSRHILDQLSPGICVLGPDGSILEMNSRAQQLLKGDYGLCARGLLLEAHDRRINALLSTAIRSSLPGQPGNHVQGGTVQIPLTDTTQPLNLVITPAPSHSPSLALPGAAALVFLLEPASRPIIDIQQVAREYGLTPAEARTAELLLAGYRPADIAAATETSPHTTKTHLTRILAKAGCSSQAQFIRAALTGPAARQQRPG